MPREAAGAAPDRRRRARARNPAQTRELRARGQLTRRRLLAAAEEVFAAKGYHATRVDDIVKLAHTSHGTFYLYFSNKEDLFRALAAEVADAMRELAESLGPLEPGPAGRERLRAWIDRLTDLYEHHGAVIRAWTEAEIGGSEFGRLGTDVLTQFTLVLNDRVAAVAPPDLDPVVASLALVAMLERLEYYVLAGQVEVKRAAMVDTLARVMQTSLFGAG
jgi:AcrR family transcriptional regulator